MLESKNFFAPLYCRGKRGGVALSKKVSNSKIYENFRISTKSERLEKVPTATFSRNATFSISRKISKFGHFEKIRIFKSVRFEKKKTLLRFRWVPDKKAPLKNFDAAPRLRDSVPWLVVKFCARAPMYFLWACDKKFQIELKKIQSRSGPRSEWKMPLDDFL